MAPALPHRSEATPPGTTSTWIRPTSRRSGGGKQEAGDAELCFTEVHHPPGRRPCPAVVDRRSSRVSWPLYPPDRGWS